MCYKIALTLSQSWKSNALDNQEEYMKVLAKKKKKLQNAMSEMKTKARH
jgi:hypothetical protein